MNQTPNDGGMLRPHPCPTCGRLTLFRRCDVCVAGEVENATTQPLPPIAQAMLRAQAMRLNHEIEEQRVGGPQDGDEFARTVAAWRQEPERIPAVRYWSGTCLMCAREIRERSSDDVTHMPPLHRIQTCPRHRRGLLALAQWLRNEKFGKGGAV